MKNYIVEISFNEPYPKTFEFRVKAAQIGRACDMAYRELKKSRKGKREIPMTFKAKQF